MSDYNGKDSITKKQKGFLDEIGYDPDKIHSKSGPVDMGHEEFQTVKTRRKKSKISLRSMIFIIGIIILLVSTGFAYSTISERESKTIADSKEYDLFQDILASDKLNYEYGPGYRYFDSGKLMTADGVGLKNALIQTDSSYSDYQFLIEIIDVSHYPVHYNRTIAEGSEIKTSALLSDGTGGDAVTFETCVNIYVDDNEIHSARFILYVW